MQKSFYKAFNAICDKVGSVVSKKVTAESMKKMSTSTKLCNSDLST